MFIVTHDLDVASGLCQRVIVLDGGRIVEQGPGDQLLRNPQTSITRTLVDTCPRLPVGSATNNQLIQSKRRRFSSSAGNPRNDTMDSN